MHRRKNVDRRLRQGLSNDHAGLGKTLYFDGFAGPGSIVGKEVKETTVLQDLWANGQKAKRGSGNEPHYKPLKTLSLTRFTSKIP